VFVCCVLSERASCPDFDSSLLIVGFACETWSVIHSLNRIKWTWISLEWFKPKEENILATRKFFPPPKKRRRPEIGGRVRPNSSNLPKTALIELELARDTDAGRVTANQSLFNSGNEAHNRHTRYNWSTKQTTNIKRKKETTNNIHDTEMTNRLY